MALTDPVESLPAKKLDRYLSKWVGKGIYNAVFDNVEDSLSLSRLQGFDFQGVNNEQYADLIEPLMLCPMRTADYYLCGPPMMIKACTKMLSELGVWSTLRI